MRAHGECIEIKGVNPVFWLAAWRQDLAGRPDAGHQGPACRWILCACARECFFASLTCGFTFNAAAHETTWPGMCACTCISVMQVLLRQYINVCCWSCIVMLNHVYRCLSKCCSNSSWQSGPALLDCDVQHSTCGSLERL